MRIAVVIPFYQRTQGLLARAVASVYAQRLPPGVSLELIIVDDASPSSVDDEQLAKPPSHVNLRVLRQHNQGAGAARNAGLDALDASVDYVAFLDSDDRWLPLHLSRALEGLSGGADMYFDDSKTDEAATSFEYSIYMRAKTGGVFGSKELFYLRRQEAFDALVDECFSHTSQVVYRFQDHAALRFDVEQRLAGEDHLFWISLAGACRQVCICNEVQGVRGEGVSIYRSTLAWDSPKALARTFDEITFRKKLLAQIALDGMQKKRVRRASREKCRQLAFLMLRAATKRRFLDLAILAKSISSRSPAVWVSLLAAAVAIPNTRRRLLSGRSAT